MKVRLCGHAAPFKVRRNFILILTVLKCYYTLSLLTTQTKCKQSAKHLFARQNTQHSPMIENNFDI